MTDRKFIVQHKRENRKFCFEGSKLSSILWVNESESWDKWTEDQSMTDYDVASNECPVECKVMFGYWVYWHQPIEGLLLEG